MAHIGYGYGSECHLLRFLGRHRKYLDGKIMEKTGGDRIELRDFDFDKAPHRNGWYDRELVGLGFLESEFPGANSAYRHFFPNDTQNWDALGLLFLAASREHLIVEAKAHLHEVKSRCEAESKESIDKIQRALSETRTFLGVSHASSDVWLNAYYQYANRLATLYYLNEKAHIPARLVLIYFIGDSAQPCPPGCKPETERRLSNTRYPQSRTEWETELVSARSQMGLPETHKLSSRVHEVFLSVKGEEA